MTYRAIDIPFFAGMDQSFDPKVLPVGPMARVENSVFERTGRLRRRDALIPRGQPDSDGTIVGTKNDLAWVYDGTLPYARPLSWDARNRPAYSSAGSFPILRHERSFQVSASSKGSTAFGYFGGVGVDFNDTIVVVAHSTFGYASQATATFRVYDRSTGDEIGSYEYAGSTTTIVNVAQPIVVQQSGSRAFKVVLGEQEFNYGSNQRDTEVFVRTILFTSISEEPTVLVGELVGNSEGFGEADIKIVPYSNDGGFLVGARFIFGTAPTGPWTGRHILREYDANGAFVRAATIPDSSSASPSSAATKAPRFGEMQIASVKKGQDWLVSFGNELVPAGGQYARIRYSDLSVGYCSVTKTNTLAARSFVHVSSSGRYTITNGPEVYSLPDAWNATITETRVGTIPEGFCVWGAGPDHALLTMTDGAGKRKERVSAEIPLAIISGIGIASSYGDPPEQRALHATVVPYGGDFTAPRNLSPTYTNLTTRNLAVWRPERGSHIGAFWVDSEGFTIHISIFERWTSGQFSSADSPSGSLVASPFIHATTNSSSVPAGFLGHPFYTYSFSGGGGDSFGFSVVAERRFGGALYESAPSAPVFGTATSLSASALPPVGAGLDTDAIVYRTEANKTILKIPGAPTTRPLYTLGGVLSNECPPACDSIVFSGGRMWAGALHHAPRRVQVSKVLEPGLGVGWSNFDTFFVEMPTPVIGLGAMDNAVLAFCEDSAYIINGDGPDNRGLGDSGLPQKILGVSPPRTRFGIITGKDGCYFVSERGIEVVPRGFSSPEFVGDAVRDVTSSFRDCRGAVSIPDDSTLRWLFTNGTTSVVLVLEQRLRAWSVLTYSRPFTSIGVTATGKMALYGETVAGSFVESGLETADSGTTAEIAQVWETGWIRPGGVNGSAYARRLNILGTWMGPCEVTVEFGFDDRSAWFPRSKTWTLSSADYEVGGDVCLELMIPVQKVWSVRFKVTVKGNLHGHAITLFYDSEGEGPRVAARSKG